MGFLKELFQKKMADAAGMEALEVGQRVHSEYSLPRLQASSPGGSKDSGGGGDGFSTSADGTTGASATAGTGSSGAFTVQPSAKSFSFVPVKRRQVEAAEQAAAQQQQVASPPQARVKYESISQFTQKVELYRGSISTVLKGVCIETGGKVIIKAYHKAKMHPKHFHKLQRELSCMRVLKGPYVAELYSSFEDPSCVYMVMEYCEGGDLFKTMLMHGGALEEQWVCVEVIAPLLRILEKMHTLRLLHRDIKPENIFLTGLGKFRLGDFGLAIKFDEEIPFSRSGTLDYMAPEVLKNPSVPFQEGRSVDITMLSARGVAPYGPHVDVWAAGVLAYELVCGRPPFEVEDEAQTAALIMYSNGIKFPAEKSPQWADFVRSVLVKNPDKRPDAGQLLQHPWVLLNLQRVMADSHRPSKDMLLQPLPLTPGHMPAANTTAAAAGAAPKFGKRTSSFTAAAPSAAAEAGEKHSGAETAAAPALPTSAPKKLPPKLSVALPTAPQLPGSFPATPTAHMALAGGLHKEKPTASSAAAVAAAGAAAAPDGARASSPIERGGFPAYGLHSPLPGAGGPANRFAADRAERLAHGSLSGDGGAAGHERAGSPSSSGSGAAKRLSHLSEVGHAGDPLPRPHHAAGSPRAPSASGSGASASAAAAAAAAASHLRPSLRVALPPEQELHEGSSGGSDGVIYSPSTPAAKNGSGMKERMKYYFQRQAGTAGGL